MNLLQKTKQFIVKKHQFKITWLLDVSPTHPYGVGAIQQKIDIVQWFGLGNPKKSAINKARKTKSGKMYLRRNFSPGTILNWYSN